MKNRPIRETSSQTSRYLLLTFKDGVSRTSLNHPSVSHVYHLSESDLDSLRQGRGSLRLLWVPFGQTKSLSLLLKILL